MPFQICIRSFSSSPRRRGPRPSERVRRFESCLDSRLRGNDKGSIFNHPSPVTLSVARNRDSSHVRRNPLLSTRPGNGDSSHVTGNSSLSTRQRNRDSHVTRHLSPSLLTRIATGLIALRMVIDESHHGATSRPLSRQLLRSLQHRREKSPRIGLRVPRDLFRRTDADDRPTA